MNRFAGILISVLSVLPCVLHGESPVLPKPKAEIALTGGQPGRYGNITIVHKSRRSQQELFGAVGGEITLLADPAVAAALRVECYEVGSLKSYASLTGSADMDKYVPSLGEEGYVLKLSGASAVIVAPTGRGVFYGLQSLKQILRAGYAGGVMIADWPDMPLRASMDDISRGAIPNMEYVKEQIRTLAELKYNALTFYIEHVVQPSSHPDFAPANGKYTMADVREICSYASSYNMEVIGSFQPFGHMEQILSLEQYRDMGDSPSMISPRSEAARKFLRDVIGELCDNFTSRYFNLNCDETWDLATGKSRDYVAQVGPAKFYADHVGFLCDIVRGKGKTPMLWADIVMKYPGIMEQLPRDLVYLPWEYGGAESFERWIKPFADAGRSFMVCPGVLNSGRIYPDMRAARANNRFITEGYRGGAAGAMLTLWDLSAVQFFTNLWYGVALAAETMWNASREMEPKQAFDTRYNIVRYGSADCRFTEAADALTALADVDVTYQLNDQVFADRFVPVHGGALTFNMAQWERADSIVAQAERIASGIGPGRNERDVMALNYSIGAYRFVVDARKTALQVSETYRRAEESYGASPQQARALLVSSLGSIAALQSQLVESERQYVELWLEENQSYFLDRAQMSYRERYTQVGELRGSVLSAINSIDCGEAPEPAALCGMDIRNVNSNYFGFWLTCGTFADAGADRDYLSEVGGEASVKPIPGLRFTISGRDYVWTKTVSSDRFTMNMADRYPSGAGGVGYAFAYVFSPDDRRVTALVGCSGEVRLELNGREVLSTGREQQFTADKYSVALDLKKGENRLLVKTRQLVGEWVFSLRIDGEDVQSHKHKYYIK